LITQEFENNNKDSITYRYTYENVRKAIVLAIENDEKIRKFFNDSVADSVLKKFVSSQEIEVYAIVLENLASFNAEVSSYFD
tara:strand:- start:42689 stop:42934 length:246 start_codon:yes stop_codon:yes gene_type:complete